MPIYKNNSRRKIQILYQGRKITVNPKEYIQGPPFFDNYKGLLKVKEDNITQELASLRELNKFTTNISEPELILLSDVNIPTDNDTNNQDFKNSGVSKVDLNNDQSSSMRDQLVTSPSTESSVIIEDIHSDHSIIKKAKRNERLIEFNVCGEKIKMKSKKRIDLKDVTFNIPLSIESEDRKRNLTLVLDYLLKYFDTNIILCESGPVMKIKDFWKPEWNNSVRCLFMENKSGFFYKTRILNKLANASTTPIIVSYDSDVLLEPNNYVLAAEKIRNNVYDFCYPFNKPLKHIERKDFISIRENLNLSSCDHLSKIVHQGVPPGGCFFMNKDKFIEAGMENENMISWGPEDQERLTRLTILGYKVSSIDGYLYHVDHTVTHNSFYTNPLYKHNVKEFDKVKTMTKDKLKEYIKGWTYG